MTLGDLFKSRRESMELSLREAAGRMKIGYGWLSNVETGKRSGLTISTLRKLQKFYGISDQQIWRAACETIEGVKS